MTAAKTTGRNTIQKGLMSYEEIAEALNLKILYPEENDNVFENIIGLNEPKKFLMQTAKIWNDPKIHKVANIPLNRKFLLVGPHGIGKAMIAYTFAKELSLPIIVIECQKFFSESTMKLMKNFKLILEKHSPTVVLFKNFEYFFSGDFNKIIAPLSTLCDFMEDYNNCFFFASLSTNVSLPEFLLSEQGFDNVLTFDVPDLKQREELLKRFIQKVPHEENIDLSKISKNTLEMTAGDLKHLIKISLTQAYIDGKDKIDYFSVDSALSSELYGQKKKSMSDEERKLTAYHEAGHVIAGYFGDPKYKLSKVEIIPRTDSLGLTIHETDEEKLSYTSEDYKNSIIISFGGMVAENLIFNTTTSGVSSDLAMATATAVGMVKFFGMDKEFGPISLNSEYFDSNLLNDDADSRIQILLKDLYSATEKLMIEHKKELIALAEALIEKECIYSEEILKIFESCK